MTDIFNPLTFIKPLIPFDVCETASRKGYNSCFVAVKHHRNKAEIVYLFEDPCSKSMNIRTSSDKPAEFVLKGMNSFRAGNLNAAHKEYSNWLKSHEVQKLVLFPSSGNI